ncbi:MAG: hypothetical protein HY846_07725 [Nitrosomonadales bacterium]|nr:hypothetical protein [Nitrosomonadales bacterium]
MLKLLCALAAAFPITGLAAQNDDLEAPAGRGQIESVWINAGFISHHFERNKGLQGNNYGLGVQVALSQTLSAVAGQFRNSNDACSRYLGWIWQPYRIGLARLGLLAGGIDGYPKMQNGGWFPLVIPVASFEYKAVGMNITVVPGYQDKLHGAVAVQFKLRVW